MRQDAAHAEQQHEHWQKVQIAWLEQNSQDARTRLSLAAELASNGLRSLTIVNGGAIVALFALVAQGAASPFVARADPTLLLAAFGAFASGIVLNLVATLLGYWSQQCIAVYETQCAEDTYLVLNGKDPRPAKYTASWNIMLMIATGFAAGSVIAFVVGSALALNAALGAVTAAS